jgi:glycosyltransferase involved in cell wall biosynthesis
MDDIRILLIAPSLDILGGQAVQATRLLAGFRNEPRIRMDFQPINARLPNVLDAIPVLRTAIRLVIYWACLLARVPKYDVIHTFSAGLTSYALWTIPALFVSRFYGKKFVLNYRDGQAELHLRTWRIAKPTLRLATVVVSPSDYVVDVFRRHGIPARRIYNILDSVPFIYRKRRQLRPAIMTNRILEPLYNVGCILRAFAIIQKRYPEATLTVAHDGCCRPELEALARELGLRNTEFVGRVPHTKVPALYDAADIYMTSPNFDCMPGSLLECFASGLPVIATGAGGIPFIVTHGVNGLLVDLNDHEGLAECAFRLLGDGDLVETLTRNGREELEKYSGDRVRGEWLKVYDELMERSAAVTPSAVGKRSSYGGV